MIKMLLSFLLIFGFIFAGIKLFNMTTTTNKIKFVKAVVFSGSCAIIAVAVLTLFVILF